MVLFIIIYLCMDNTALKWGFHIAMKSWYMLDDLGVLSPGNTNCDHVAEQ